MQLSGSLGAVLAAMLAIPAPAVRALDVQQAFRQGLEAYERDDGLRAAEYWEPCAITGDPRCQYALGVLHDGGTTNWPGDATRAIQWLTKAARHGNLDAQIRLGFLYAIGRPDVSQSIEEAYIWFSMAAGGGSAAAVSHRARVMELMTETELERANNQLIERGISYRIAPPETTAEEPARDSAPPAK